MSEYEETESEEESVSDNEDNEDGSDGSSTSGIGMGMTKKDKAAIAKRFEEMEKQFKEF